MVEVGHFTLLLSTSTLLPVSDTQTPSDADLALQVQGGNRDALGMLYERYVNRIFTYVYYRTHHRATAEDIVSQTFLRALEKIASYDPNKGVFSAWLHRIARNLIIDHFRSVRPMQSIEDAWGLPDDDDVTHQVDANLKVDTIRLLLQQLSAEQREIVLLRLWHGYSFAEIGEILGKSEDSCKMACSRALSKIRAEVLLLLLTFFFHA